MNILFLSRLFYPHIGGVEKHVLEVSTILLKKGYSVSVITEKFNKSLKNKENLKGIDVYRIPVIDNWFKKFAIWKWLWRNRKLIENADIIHCHDVFFWYFPFRLFYPKKPAYTTFHGYESYPVSRKAIFVRKISEILSWGNMCIGDFIQKWYGTKPNFVSYGGVDIMKMKNEKWEMKNKNSAVFIGRLDEQTGFLTYLEAVRKIREKIPDFKFSVFGDGKFRNKISKDIDFKGFIKNPEKELPKFNFVFASRYLSILEAMAAKRLVLAVYDNSVKKDYLEISPFAKLINIVGSENELAEKVLYFLKNPKEEETIVSKALEWVKNQSWENLANTYIKLWRGNG